MLKTTKSFESLSKIEFSGDDSLIRKESEHTLSTDLSNSPRTFRTIKFGNIKIGGFGRPIPSKVWGGEIDRKNTVEQQIEFIKSNFNVVVVLESGVEGNGNLPTPLKNSPGFKIISNFITDEEPPTFEDLINVMNEIKIAHIRRYNIGIHCAAGYGRTGTMLACAHLIQKLTTFPLFFELNELDLNAERIKFEIGNSSWQKADPIIVETICEVRKIEKLQWKTGEKYYSVAMDEEIKALEIYFRLFVISHRLYEGIKIDDMEILKLVKRSVDNNFLNNFFYSSLIRWKKKDCVSKLDKRILTIVKYMYISFFSIGPCYDLKHIIEELDKITS